MPDRKTMPASQKIGKYVIVKEIGEGSFGKVLRVFDPVLQVERALKVPFSSGDRVDMALHEARNQARMNHPGVVQIYGVEEIGDKLAIVMEYAKGGSLRDRLVNRGALGVEECMQCVEEIAGALAEAHKKDPPLLHYDVKPENSLFDENGHAKLADFGISRRMEQPGRKMSRIMGTPEYMGPEQLNGVEDKRSEIWSLGAVFYEMLTGQICFEANTQPLVIEKISKGQFKPLRKVNPKIPVPVERIVHKMLALNPAQRYQSMEEVIDDLLF